MNNILNLIGNQRRERSSRILQASGDDFVTKWASQFWIHWINQANFYWSLMRSVSTMPYTSEVPSRLLGITQGDHSVCYAGQDQCRCDSISRLFRFPAEQSLSIRLFFSLQLQPTGNIWEHHFFSFSLSFINTSMPNGPLMSWTDFRIFYIGHLFFTEPGQARDIGAIEIWLIDWCFSYWSKLKVAKNRDVFKVYENNMLRQSC